jgi:hypothetical protein
MKNSLFDVNSEQKKIISDISALCGVKQETVTQVWKYTLLMNYLSLLEGKEKNCVILQIPLVGKIWCRFDKEKDEYETHLILNDQIKEAMKKTRIGDDNEVVKFYEAEFISPILQEIEES